MDVIHLAIYLAELALAGIILFYVVAMLTMPANMIRVCQGLIVLIFVFAAIGAVLGGAPSTTYHLPSIGSTPSIMAPERSR